MKCDFPKNDNTCRRCKSGGHVCIVEGRKPRTAPNKREYLLAQIRQKDAIIENLLKQLHNPYIATPLSIASYRMATSPSDENNHQVIEWLDRLKASVATAGAKAGPKAFTLDARGQRGPGDDDSDDESPSKTYAQAFGLTPPVDNDGEDDDDGSTEGTDKLRQSLPDSHVPLGLFANLALSNRKMRKQEDGKESYPNDQNDENVGVANDRYFMPGPATDLSIRAALIEQHSPPEILVHGLVQPADVDRLFEIGYVKLQIFIIAPQPFVSLLDPVLHTPATTFARCPFLLPLVICAISSRYYAEKSEVYPIAMHFAKHSAANALINGWKSVELCQAYILMSIYAVPARRWEDDRSWLYTGLAIRIATDLNLHQQEREILNRTRVWMMCSNLDRSTATTYGKPPTYFLTHLRLASYEMQYDIHLCAHSTLLNIVARFHDEIFSDPSSPTGLNKQVDFRTVTMTHDAHLTQHFEEWTRRFSQDSDPNDRSSAFRCTLLPFLVGYSRLVMFSFGFQQAFHRGIEPGDEIFFFKVRPSFERNM
ncbi:hypothetical protein BD779DRAFT_1545499 [Infundibulicybe gibba]|nr:hypothetical protein BD779DRAFT_1545499 [Infundibulicybe gibba]